MRPKSSTRRPGPPGRAESHQRGSRPAGTARWPVTLAPCRNGPLIENECLGRNGIRLATASRLSCSPSTPTRPTGSSAGSGPGGYTARRYSGQDPPDIRDEIRAAFAGAQVPDHRLHRRRQRGNRPPDRPRARQLGHPLVLGPARTADGPDSPVGPGARCGTLQPHRHRHPRGRRAPGAARQPRHCRQQARRQAVRQLSAWWPRIWAWIWSPCWPAHTTTGPRRKM